MRQSRQIMERVEKWIEVYRSILFNKFGRKLNLLIDNQTQKQFENGKSIYALPSNPNTIRGFFGNVKLDEFTLHKNQKKIYEALYPTIMRGYRISIGATPLSKTDLFHEIVTNKRKYPKFKRHQTTILDAQADGLVVDIEELRAGLDDESFDQEFLCVFLDAGGTFFPIDIINVEDYEITDLPADSPNYLGVDVGRVKDLTVISIVKKIFNKIYLVHYEVLKKKKFGEQREYIKRLFQYYQCEYGQIDESGLGMQLAEELNEWNKNIAGLAFTNQSKARLATQTRKMFENKDLSIYDDRDLIVDIHSINKNVSNAGNIIFQSDADANGHADRFWSLAIAVDTALNKNAKIITHNQY